MMLPATGMESNSAPASAVIAVFDVHQDMNQITS
jgi:hypothetical protein